MDLPKRAGDAPIRIELEEGKKYAWCTCGLSDNQPFCNGAHKGTDYVPMVKVAEKTGMHSFCTCKLTKNGPFCDGAHK